MICANKVHKHGRRRYEKQRLASAACFSRFNYAGNYIENYIGSLEPAAQPLSTSHWMISAPLANTCHGHRN